MPLYQPNAATAANVSVADAAANFTGTNVETVLAELQDNIDAGVGSGIADTIMDAKGDLIAASAADTPARFGPVGADGTVLTAASGEAQGLKWGTPFVSYVTVAVPQGLVIADGASDAFGTSAAAQLARATPILIPGRMRVRSLWISISASAAGSIEWGLFDYSASLTSATKLAGGSAAPGGTNWREIAASGAPVDVPAGQYMLVVFNPLTNPSTIRTASSVGGSSPGFWKAFSTYTWDDTPDFTSGSWADSSVYWACYLEGDLDASSTRW